MSTTVRSFEATTETTTTTTASVTEDENEEHHEEEEHEEEQVRFDKNLNLKKGISLIELVQNIMISISIANTVKFELTTFSV